MTKDVEEYVDRAAKFASRVTALAVYHFVKRVFGALISPLTAPLGVYALVSYTYSNLKWLSSIPLIGAHLVALFKSIDVKTLAILLAIGFESWRHSNGNSSSQSTQKLKYNEHTTNSGEPSALEKGGGGNQGAG